MQLDDYIRAHRDQLNSREPSERVWKGIEHRLFPAPSSWNTVAVWRAAAILLLGTCAFLVILLLPSRAVRRDGHELSELTQFYTAEIAKKTALISSFDNRLDEEPYTQEMRKLEAMYLVLADELKRKPSRELRDAVVLNMLVRIDLLNQQIKRLEDARQAGPAAPPPIGV